MSTPARRRLKGPDYSGQRFGRLVARRQAAIGIYYGKHLERRWVCDCDCGAETIVVLSSLRSGNTTSCGCRAQEAKEATGPEHSLWGGDDVGYHAIHSRLRKYRGRAVSFACSRCKGAAEQWAYRWDVECSAERLGVSKRGTPPRPYCPHLEHYDPMCLVCHRAFDRSDERGVA